MLVFSTEFPVDNSHSTNRFQEAVKKWITGSPHTKLTNDDFVEIHEKGEWELSFDGEEVHSLSNQRPGYEASAIRYTKHSDSMRWATTITFLKKSVSWVGVSLICDSDSPTTRIPPYKKPLVVRTLLQELGGGLDGDLVVQSNPFHLDNADIDRAARAVTGCSAALLPIVYVSARFQGGHSVRPQNLASELSGMAHVLVEPNRAFSHRLKISVGSRNAYGGAIGIYWPNGDGRRSLFRSEDFSSPQELEERISTEVRSALVNRRPTSSCTWASVQNEVAHQTYLRLKEEKSQEVDDFTKEFDKELSAKAELLQLAEREIARLRAEMRRYESQTPKSSQALIYCGNEQDFYEGEIIEFIRDALQQGLSNTRKDSRRSHVLSEIVDSLPSSNEAGSRREKLKSALREYKCMDAKAKSTLEELGFSVSADGKHFKLVYQDDERYTFSLPKSGSDYRGGLNSASDIATLFL